ncbi:molybdate ABC transporter substrate-binding protein [candidate division KSB1 bacterium]|nr:molybdate ABC transporter substrate-binding protein [candidate division KSB1 bacterium]NIR70624.1 molybdate ABC transporter substrate-binding protein [candidate division KSB1 bacterium]NIS23429.1 molybdate ABC transporter substrate-binding protein [candidate division KSB1 bacterium]NIT74564.1 molybdate ABC transporter substrate-binding protein [candidate division KSB1 bacterium]NIU28391.1 molybdate ABC transporter substrate-binding protein [candidate division KSB1 bacterium]
MHRHKNGIRLSRLIIVILCVFSGCALDTDKSDLQVFAAASLTSVMPQVLKAFEKKYPTTEVEFNFAASSILAKQIEHGAEADIFISADPDWVDFLIEQGRLHGDSRTDILSNELVLIGPKQNSQPIRQVQDLRNSSVGKIALADWSHVPAGMYAKQALVAAGIWDEIKSKCLPALDVRAALSYVERGDAECGIVYRTDAMISKRVEIANTLPETIQPDIVYSMAIVNAMTPPAVNAFYNFLRSAEAGAVFKENGFIVLEHE